MYGGLLASNVQNFVNIGSVIPIGANGFGLHTMMSQNTNHPYRWGVKTVKTLSHKEKTTRKEVR